MSMLALLTEVNRKRAKYVWTMILAVRTYLVARPHTAKAWVRKQYRNILQFS